MYPKYNLLKVLPENRSLADALLTKLGEHAKLETSLNSKAWNIYPPVRRLVFSESLEKNWSLRFLPLPLKLKRARALTKHKESESTSRTLITRNTKNQRARSPSNFRESTSQTTKRIRIGKKMVCALKLERNKSDIHLSERLYSERANPRTYKDIRYLSVATLYFVCLRHFFVPLISCLFFLEKSLKKPSKDDYR